MGVGGVTPVQLAQRGVFRLSRCPRGCLALIKRCSINLILDVLLNRRLDQLEDTLVDGRRSKRSRLRNICLHFTRR